MPTAAAALLNYCRNSVSTFNKKEEHLFTVSYGSQYQDSSGALGKRHYFLENREKHQMLCCISLHNDLANDTLNAHIDL